MEHGNAYPGIPSGYGTPLQNRRHIPTASETSPYKWVASCKEKNKLERMKFYLEPVVFFSLLM